MKPDAKSPLKKSLPLIGIVFAAVLLYVLFGDYLTFAALAENREALIAWRDSNYLLAALTYVLIYIAVVGFSIPGAVFLSLGGGFLFGALTGTLLTVVGATIGATAIFLAAKTGLGNALQARLERNGEGRLARMQAGLKENEISYLFLMRLVPAVPFWFANLAPAFLGVGLRNFVLTTFIGIIPGTAVYLWVGSGLGEVFARGDTPDLGIIFEWQILGPILALSALSALPILLKVFRKTGVEA
ncbi:MAG: TVP38/TMEM64 family protein [Rhodobacteraceae bacterium]|nr:TVP38/TMEM64 family protein [Paracoccaceae bacterium]